MRRALLLLPLLAALCVSPALAQSKSQLGPLCTTETTPADQMIAACNKIIALKVFSGSQLATIYFWRAVGWNKKGDYARVISDATEALRLQPAQAIYNLRGSAYYDKGEYEIAIADFNDAIKNGPPSGTLFHNRGNAHRGAGDFAKAIADYDQAIKLTPKSALSWQNRGISREATGDLDGALTDINEAIRLDPALASPLINRSVIWRAKGNVERAIADGSEAVRLAQNPPANVMTPPGSVVIAAHVHRALAYEAKGEFDAAKADYAAALKPVASDAGSKANQATAKVRLSLLSEPVVQPPQRADTPQPAALATGQRMALVIGNGAYAHVQPLTNPPRDARAIAKSLRDIGFTVVEGIDLDRAAMQAKTRDFLREATRAQMAVVFYAGHGVQIDGRNYLVPTDIALSAGSEIVTAMVDMDLILAGLDDQVRTNILILDACRNNPFAPPEPAAPPSRSLSASGLAAPSSLGAGATSGAGTLIAFATAPGKVALDGEGDNSPFSAALSRHIGTPGLEVQQMLTRVRAEVVAGTRNRQVPWSNSSLLGEVYLAAK
ncbi:tetratricopeptide repeat protein [Bradyrhizobium sp. 83002]|uniref:caspase family protein n=1 Tax=Bradyrhizobium aeschynomenes TaxID=2734909 RepID=UPI0015575760|nr:caspase family protein [Bradyrhizobium aeschynomenes]NPU12370.1 tetratricopeptide repeat protein [Bradyrhizobium aeschynomenes]NPV22928.1 tetratricopeptide repeat protein [Bradyrhizobium aeschynomenes]